MNPFRPISISFSPNTESDDIRLAWKILFQPWLWRHGRKIQELEEEFREYLGVKYAFSFNGGRSSLIAILKSLGIGEGDEVLLQAFTCNAAVNPISWREAKPVFVDIDESLNLDPEDLKRKITNRSRVVMIQHTFGWPAKIAEVKNICQKHNLFLIEDCAHSLGARYKKRLIGTFGDAAFFSFGRDKVISSVYGGMVVTNNERIAQMLKGFQDSLPFPSNIWILQQILHPISFAAFLPIYSFLNLGKGVLYLKQRLKILSPSVYQQEKQGKQLFYFPKRLPNALAMLASNQFRKLGRLNMHRREIAEIYNSQLSQMKAQICPSKEIELVYMRYPIFIDDAKEIRERLKKKNIFLDDGWHTLPIVPPGTDLEKMNYTKGSCPRAEEVARKILNLPTNINISRKETKRIVDTLLKFVK